MNELIYMKLDDSGLIYHHTSTASGYISRKKKCEIEPYVGRFGIGIKVLIPRYDSTRYHYVSYYIYNPIESVMSDIILYCKESKKEERLAITGYRIGKYTIELHLVDGSTRFYNKKKHELRLEVWKHICD